jgi:hypothetical protein
MCIRIGLTLNTKPDEGGNPSQRQPKKGKQQDLRGALQETVRQRGELEKRGKVLRSLLASLLRGSLGFDNQTLLGFGVKPRRPRTKKKAPGDTPAPQPSAQQ